MKDTLLLGTRKGLVVYRHQSGDWKMTESHFDGIPVSLAYEDERNGHWWACLDHGHWGVKLHRSKDHGKNWEELTAPTYPEGSEIKEGVPATTRLLWAIQQGGRNNPNRLWIGTEPGGLFRSDNGGENFHLVESLWNFPKRAEQWFGGGRDHAGIHSIIVDPRDEDHLYIGVSCAGVFETKDGGQTWRACNKGLRADFLPDPYSDIGHDPHLLVAAPTNPDIMWQQNHCGIFKSSNGGQKWVEVSQKDGPANFGFAIAIAEDNPEQVWVAPALSDTHRVAIDKSLCISRTDDGGKTWTDHRKGLPQGHAYDIVYRHALGVNQDHVIFGTTTGNLFLSKDRGENWQVLNNYLPMVHSVSFGQ